MSPTPNPFDYASTSKAIHATLDQALATIPPGKRGALLMQLDLANGTPVAHFTVAGHIDGNWEVAAGGAWDGKATPSAQIAVMGSW